MEKQLGNQPQAEIPAIAVLEEEPEKNGSLGGSVDFKKDGKNPALTVRLSHYRLGDMADVVMVRVNEIFEKSGMTLDELGRKMGYPDETARKSAWQFLRQTNDPRLSMLRKFAKAARVPLRDLV